MSALRPAPRAASRYARRAGGAGRLWGSSSSVAPNAEKQPLSLAWVNTLLPFVTLKMVTAWDTPSFMAGSFGGRELMRGPRDRTCWGHLLRKNPWLQLQGGDDS